ncbi:MAG: hypothetical protein ABF254_05890 [Octadecabacter sp.]
MGSGVPIAGEAGVRYVMRAGYDLPPLMFNSDEFVALIARARMIRAWGGATSARISRPLGLCMGQSLDRCRLV